MQHRISTSALERLSAMTGALLLLCVLVHLGTALRVLSGPEAVNGHAAWVGERGLLLWAGRALFAGSLAGHVAATLVLTRRRPLPGSRSLVVTGLLVLLLVVYYLMQTTLGVVILPERAEWVDPLERKDVYSILVAGFQALPVTLFYAVGLFGLALHLQRGLARALERRGWMSLDPLAASFAWLLAAAHLVVPVAALCGLLELPAWHEGRS